jgi:hypothetical protein
LFSGLRKSGVTSTLSHTTKNKFIVQANVDFMLNQIIQEPSEPILKETKFYIVNSNINKDVLFTKGIQIFFDLMKPKNIKICSNGNWNLFANECRNKISLDKIFSSKKFTFFKRCYLYFMIEIKIIEE